MRRARKTDYGYNSTFPNNLRKIMDDNNTTQAVLAKECGVQRQSVAQWMNGNTMPDILSLKKIAVHFGVSSDYLLGLAKDPTTDADLRAVCDYTWLSVEAIDFIKNNPGIDIELLQRFMSVQKQFGEMLEILNHKK